MGCCTNSDINQPYKISRVLPKSDSLILGFNDELVKLDQVIHQNVLHGEDKPTDEGLLIIRQESFRRNSKLHVLSLQVFKIRGIVQNTKAIQSLQKYRIALGEESYQSLMEDIALLEFGLEENSVKQEHILELSDRYHLSTNELLTAFRNQMNHTLLDLILIFRRRDCYHLAFNSVVVEDIPDHNQDALCIRVFFAIVHPYQNEEEMKSTTQVFMQLIEVHSFKQLFMEELENQLFFIDRIFDFRSKWQLKLLKGILRLIKHQKLLCEKGLIDMYIAARRDYIFQNLQLPKTRTNLIQQRELYYLEHLRYSIFDELSIKGQFDKLLEYWPLSPSWMFGLQSSVQLEKFQSPKQTSPYQRLLQFGHFDQISNFHRQLLASEQHHEKIIQAQISKTNHENFYHLLIRNKQLDGTQLLNLLQQFKFSDLMMQPNKFSECIPVVAYIAGNGILVPEIISLLSTFTTNSHSDDISCFKITNIIATRLDPSLSYGKLKFNMSQDKMNPYDKQIEQVEKICNQEYLRSFKLLEAIADQSEERQLFILEHLSYKIDFSQLYYVNFRNNCVQAKNIVASIMRARQPALLLESILKAIKMNPFLILRPSEFFDCLLGNFMASKGWHQMFNHQNRYINNITLLLDGFTEVGCTPQYMRSKVEGLLRDASHTTWDFYLRPSFHLNQLCPFGSLYSMLSIIQFEGLNQSQFEGMMENLISKNVEEQQVLWLVLSYIHILTCGRNYEALQQSCLTQTINKIEFMEYKALPTHIFQLLQINQKPHILMHYKCLLSSLCTVQQSPLNYWIADEIEDWSWSLRTLKTVLDLVFSGTPRFEILAPQDLEKYYCRYPSFFTKLLVLETYQAFQQHLKTNSVDLKYAILRNLILNDLRSANAEINILAVYILRELQDTYGCNICIKLFYISRDQIPKMIKYIFQGIVFEMNIPHKRRHQVENKSISCTKYIKDCLQSDAYEQLFAESLIQNCHPYSVLAVDPKFKVLQTLLNISTNLLQLFDVKPIYEACVRALQLNEVGFVRQCLQLIKEHPVGELEKFQQSTILQWLFKMCPCFTGRRKLHLTMKVVVRRNPITKKTSLTQEQVEEYCFQDRFFQGQITWSGRVLSNLIKLDKEKAKMFMDVVGLLIEYVGTTEQEFATMIQLKNVFSQQYQSGGCELEKQDVQIEHFCRRTCIWYYEPQGNFNLPVVLMMLPYLPLQNIHDPAIKRFILHSVCIEPLVLIQSMQLLSHLTLKIADREHVASALWQMVFHEAKDSWVNELILNCSVQLGSMVHGLLQRNQYSLLYGLLVVMVEYRPVDAQITKNLISMIELMLIFTCKRSLSLSEPTIDLTQFLKRLLECEFEHKILNKSQLRELYEIFLRSHVYEVLKVLVSRIFHKKKARLVKCFPQSMAIKELQFYQAMQVHWSICFTEEMFQCILNINSAYLLAKTNRLKYIMIGLSENGLHNKIKMFLSFLELHRISQEFFITLYLDNLLITQKFGFMQKFMKPNESWFKFYQQHFIESVQEHEDSQEEEFQNKVYNFFGSYRQMCLHNRVYSFTPNDAPKQTTITLTTTKQLKMECPVSILGVSPKLSYISDAGSLYQMVPTEQSTILSIGSQNYMLTDIMLFDRIKKQGRQMDNEPSLQELYIHAIVFHCILTNDFDIQQILKDLHLDMVKVFPKITSIVIKLIHKHRNNKSLLHVIQTQLIPPFLVFYQKHLQPQNFTEALWKLLLYNTVGTDSLVDQILFETLVVFDLKGIKAFNQFHVSLPYVQSIITKLIHHQFWDKRLGTLISKFQFGLTASQKEVYFCQLKATLDIDTVPPQFLLQSYREDYLIRLLKCNFFLPLEAVYPFHPLSQQSLSNTNVTLTEFLLMRGLTKILALLQAKHPSKSTIDLNRYIQATVVGSQNFSVMQSAIDMVGKGAVVSNLIQDSLLSNKCIQSLVQCQDERGLLVMFKKYFIQRLITAKELRTLEFSDQDGTHHVIMKCIFIRSKFLVYLVIEYMQNKIFKGKRDEFLKTFSKMLTQSNDFVYSKKIDQMTPLQMSIFSNCYEVQALIVDCQCQVTWLDPFEGQLGSRFLMHDDAQLEEVVMQECYKQLPTLVHQIRLFKVLRQVYMVHPGKDAITDLIHLERICLYLNYSVYHTRQEQIYQLILLQITNPVIQTILFCVLGCQVDPLELAQQTTLDSHLILCYICWNKQDNLDMCHFLETSEASQQLQIVKELWKNQELLEILSFLRKDKILTQSIWQLRNKSQLRFETHFEQLIEHYCHQGDQGLVHFVLQYLPNMFLDDEALREQILYDMKTFLSIYKSVLNHQKEFVCTVEQLLKILLNHPQASITQLFLLTLQNIKKYPLMIVLAGDDSTTDVPFFRWLKHVVTKLGITGLQQNLINAQQHYTQVTKMNPLHHQPIPQSQNGRVLIPADEPELVDCLVRFIQLSLAIVEPESIDAIIRSIVRINRKYCQLNNKDLLGERLQLIILVLDFMRKSETLIDQIEGKLQLPIQLVFVSSSKKDLNKNITFKQGETCVVVYIPTKLIQNPEDQPQIYFVSHQFEEVMTHIYNQTFMAQHFSHIMQALLIFNDQVSERFLSEQFKTHLYSISLSGTMIESSHCKRQILRQLGGSILMAKSHSLECRDSVFGLSEMLSDLARLQSMELGCSKLYHLDDLFAPHNTVNQQQIRESSSSNTSRISSFSTIKSECSNARATPIVMIGGVQIVAAEKKQQSFFIKQLPDSSYQLKQRSPSRSDSSLFPEFYVLSQTAKVIQISFISLQLFKQKSSLLCILDAVQRDLSFYKHFINEVVTKGATMHDEHTWEVAISQHGIAFNRELFQPYRLSKLRAIFSQFQASLLPIRVNRKHDYIWQFNSQSFMKEIMQPYVAGLELHDCSLFQHIERMLQTWGMLRKVLSTILYQNLLTAKSLMKVISTVYVEFSCCQGGVTHHQPAQCEYDKMFQFERTNYRIYKHTLVVTLNLRHMVVGAQCLSPTNLIFVEDEQLKDYLLTVTNQFDFFESLLTNQQIVQFIFNKRDVESMLLKFSQELSEVLSKNISISLNFNQLQAIFRKQLTRIQYLHGQQRISEYRSIWRSLESLSLYLLDRSRQEIQTQLLRDEVQELFQTILQTLILALREEPYDATKNQQSVLQQKLVQSSRSFKLNDINDEKKMTQQVGLIEYLGQLNEKLIMYSFALQVELNYFLANVKLGEIYIIGWQNGEGQQVACAQIASKSKPNIIGFINLENQSYVKVEVLVEREQRSYSLNELDAALRFKYQSVEVDEIKFVMAVCKTFPESTMFLNSISNLAIIDGDCNVLLIKDPCLIQHCILLQKSESEQEKKKIRDFLTINGNFDQLTVSNLVQFIPNCFSIEFEHHHNPKHENESHSPHNPKHEPTTTTTTTTNDGKIRILLDAELNYKISSINLQQTKITCQLEQNQQFTSYLFSFLQWVQQIFQDVKGRKVLVLQKQNRELRDKLALQSSNIEQASSVFEVVSEAALHQHQQTQNELLASDAWIQESGLFDSFEFVFVYAPELEDNHPHSANQSYFVHLISSRIDDVLLNLYQAFKEFFLCQDLPAAYKKQLQQYFAGDLICNEMNLLGHYRFKLFRRHISRIEIRFFEGNGPALVEVVGQALQINCYATYPSQTVYFPYANNILDVMMRSVTHKQIEAIRDGSDFAWCIDREVRAYILEYVTVRRVSLSIDFEGINIDDIMQVEFLVSSLLIAANNIDIDLHIGASQDSYLHIPGGALQIRLTQSMQHTHKHDYQFRLNSRDISRLIMQFRNRIQGFPDDTNNRILAQDNNELITLKEDVTFTYSGEILGDTSYHMTLVNMQTAQQVAAQTVQLPKASKYLNFSFDECLWNHDHRRSAMRFILIVESDTQVLNVRCILIIQCPSLIQQPHDLDFLCCSEAVNECLIGQIWSVLVPVLSLPDLFVQDVPLLQVLSLRKPLHKLTISIISKYVTQNWILITIYGKKVGKVCIKEYRNKAIIIRSLDRPPTSMIEVVFITNRDVSLKNTRIISKKKQDEDVNLSSMKGKQQDNTQVGKFFSALGRDQGTIRLVTIKEQIVIESIEQIEQIKSFQSFNLLASLSKKEQSISTRAGQTRTEVLLFCDAAGNAVKPTSEFLDQLRYMFVHQTIPHFVYRAQAKFSLDSMTVELTWRPLTKGFYNLIINGEPVKTKTSLVVLAGPVSAVNSQVQIQENNKRAFFDKNLAIFSFKDEFFNVFGDVEKSLFEGNNELFRMELESSMGSSLQCLPKPIDKTGQQLVEFIFETELVDQGNNDTPLMRFYLKDAMVKELKITINGISVEKRKKHFLRELSKVVNTTRQLDFSVKRVNIVEDLLKLENMDLKKSFSIKFQDEEGIDMGGLQREFYDLVGITMKDHRYKFFSANVEERYHFNNEMVLIREKLKYAKIFGALLANSIANKQIIGVELSTPFVKVLYGEAICFSDLADIIDTKGYEFLRGCSEEELESSCLDFTVTFNKQVHELIQGGSNVAVDRQNLELYLDTMAKFEIRDKFEMLFNAFKLGFESVFKIDLLAKWIRPNEISIFTVGQKEINHENLQKVIIFKSGNNKLNNFFQQYLQHADSAMLKNFLKFTTGSSSMPFDTSDFKIKVEFNAQMGKNILPISHTCFKSIEIPHYTSYDLMKKKLDTAFTIGAEGFGFG